MVTSLLVLLARAPRLLLLLSCSSFVWMWLRIELVSLRVALFILLNSSANELRRKKRSLLLKYLLVQFVSRGITLASWFLAESWGALLFTVSLCLKLGLFPAHS